jgi:hypothetical protein
VIDIADIRRRWRQAASFLDERGRRLFAANEALAQGHGGVAATSIATGLARSAIGRGIQELRSAGSALGARLRRPGGGRKRAVAHQPGLPAALEGLIEDAIRGDPGSPLRWVSRSQRHLVQALTAQGFQVSQRLVGKLLRELNHGCQADRKTREGSNNPDRNAQFEHVNARVRAAIAAGEPAISVDTKKRGLVGDFKNNGRELRRKGDPEPVRGTWLQDPRPRQGCPLRRLRHCRRSWLGQRRHQRRHRGVRRRKHPALVAQAGQGTLS